MKKFIVIPYGCNWSDIEAATAEMAYRAVCCWYSPEKWVAIYDPDTGKTVIFSRKLDSAGNLVEIVQH